MDRLDDELSFSPESSLPPQRQSNPYDVISSSLQIIKEDSCEDAFTPLKMKKKKKTEISITDMANYKTIYMTMQETL